EAWVDAPVSNELGALENHPWADQNWLRAEVQAVLIQGLRKAKSLRTISGNLVSPEAAWIPVSEAAASSLELWSVTERLIVAADKLPQRVDQEAWARALDSWAPFLATAQGQFAERWGTSRLADHLASLRNVATLKSALKPEEEPLAWINRVHEV